MTIRLQISFFLILISITGVLGASFFILQTATRDKKNYVTELSSVLSPQIKDSIDQKVQTLLLDLNDFTEIIETTSQKKNSAIEKHLESLKLRLKNTEAVLILQADGKLKDKLITIKLAATPISEEELQSVILSMSHTSITDLKNESLLYLKSNYYFFKTSQQNIGVIKLNPDFFKNSFELARGKKSLLINHQEKNKNLILYNGHQETDDAHFISQLPITTLKGSELFSQELKDDQNRPVLFNYSKLKNIQDSYVLIISPQVTWQDLVEPLIKSSISLILILVLTSIIIAYSISRSLAQPIELLSEETSKIGLGEWKTISLINSKNEISKLGLAFNRMIFNLINRENELKIAHNKLIQSESLAAVGRISAGIAHEVKNPLSSILGYCQLIDINLKTIIGEASMAPLHEKLEKIKSFNKLVIDDTRRANKIISDLLTFSRQKEIQVEKINLYDYLILIEPKLKTFCESQSVGFTFICKADPLTTFVQIDHEQIYQVLFNLVQNAVHALNSTENPQKLIQLFQITEADHAFIEIRDNGPGISEKNIAKIFEPFFSTKKVGEGSGLGLAICYGIITQHNGQILVESVPQQYTSFKIKLPIFK